MTISLINELTHALRCLPGVGPKSAQRMCYHLLQQERNKGLHLASCIKQAMEDVIRCERCNNFSQTQLCAICADPKREKHILCIVENPNDLAIIEHTKSFNGNYYVLMGLLSPLDGIGPNELGLDVLKQLIEKESISEVIFALNPNIESEATIHYISTMLSNKEVRCTQLAQGIPMGGELEYCDPNTIMKALKQRDSISLSEG